MTSVRNEIMFAVSRTVSPWAIWLFCSSRSERESPSALAAEAKEKRVRVELSRKIEIARPVSNARNEVPSWWRRLKVSASVRIALICSSGCSQVRRKSFWKRSVFRPWSSVTRSWTVWDGIVLSCFSAQACCG